ncbi:MAG: tRNA uridine(34) 5-carboxymethylaminomethyl modification radical SAM/GNAT enzyme Elp3 [Candidatus Woesearchaeota archaeon]
MDFYSEIIDWIKYNMPDKLRLSKHKKDLCKKYGIKEIPTDINIYLNASPEDAKIIRSYLQTKPMRTGSGVTVIATMTKPINCPHGSCIYCPGGLGSEFGDVPKSYTGKEPSTMRGIRNQYDPYRIIFNRLEQYIVIGQNPDKVDQIIMGGTFTSFPKTYQEEYIYYSFKAYNDFSRLFYKNGELDIEYFKKFFELPGDVSDINRTERIKHKVMSLKNQNIRNLQEEQQANEYAAIRCIGITIETKPDWATVNEGLELLKLGVTRIELGVQTVYDEILRYVNRGHNIKDTTKAISDMRDLGFKLNFHMMPGLPDEDGHKISKNKDIDNFKILFDNPNFRPDMLKIYPCMVMPGTLLKKSYEEGKFKPLTTEEAAEIIVESYKFIPEYCRIMRIQRDIPTYATISGVDKTNLRQYVDELAKAREIHSKDIRAREIGLQKIEGKPDLKVMEYEANKGKEYFISMELNEKRGSGSKILGFVRLRIPSKNLHPSITSTSALIRELHVYGQAVSIGKSDEDKTQHKGIGKVLMAKAEELAILQGKDKMIVISGVGVRGYYRKLGYVLEGPYMVKMLKKLSL